MRRILALILSAASLFNLTLFAPKQVPDQTIEWLVEDYLKEYGQGTASEHTYEVTHVPDKSTKTDTVHVDLAADLPHASITSTYDATYQFNKSSDLWSVLRGEEWAPVSVSSYRLDYSEKPLLAILREQDPSAEAVPGSYFANKLELEPETEVVDSWVIETTSTNIDYCELADAANAHDVFLMIYSWAIGLTPAPNVEVLANAAGENYYYYRCKDTEYQDEIVLICQDQHVMILWSEEEEIIDKILKETGFIPNMACVPFDPETDAKRLAYRTAEEYYEEGDLDSALAVFRQLGDFEDSEARVEEVYEAKRAAMYAAAEALLDSGDYDAAAAQFRILGGYQDSAERVKEAEEAKKAAAYAAAESLFQKGDYDGAKEAFSALGDYADSAARVEEVTEAKNAAAYAAAEALLEKKQFEAAIDSFRALGTYSDSADRTREAIYLWASDLYEKKNYADAAVKFAEILDYQDSADRAHQALYDGAVELGEKGLFDSAIQVLTELGDYGESKARLKEYQDEKTYQTAVGMLSYGNGADYDANAEAREMLLSLGDYKDSKEILDHILYDVVKSYEGYSNSYEYHYGASGPTRKVYEPEMPELPYEARSYHDDGTPSRMEGNRRIVEITDGNKSEVYTYDENDRLISLVKEVNRSTEELLYTFDNNGRLIKVIDKSISKGEVKRGETVLYPTNTITETMTASYNQDGLITAIERTYQETRQDDNCRTSYNASFSQGGTYSYNQYGKITKSSTHDSWKSPSNRTISSSYQYDETGRLSSGTIKDSASSNSVLYLNYEYFNDKVVCTKNRSYGSFDDIKRVTYSYGYIWAPDYEP